MKQYLYKVIYTQYGLWGTRHHFEIVQAGGEELVRNTITMDCRYRRGSLFIKQVGEVDIDLSADVPMLTVMVAAGASCQISENIHVLLSTVLSDSLYEATKIKFLKTESSEQPKPIRRLELQR